MIVSGSGPPLARFGQNVKDHFPPSVICPERSRFCKKNAAFPRFGLGVILDSEDQCQAPPLPPPSAVRPNVDGCRGCRCGQRGHRGEAGRRVQRGSGYPRAHGRPQIQVRAALCYFRPRSQLAVKRPLLSLSPSLMSETLNRPFPLHCPCPKLGHNGSAASTLISTFVSPALLGVSAFAVAQLVTSYG